MTAYYNEIDTNAAQWLRNLIHAGHIAPGIVDERSIEDVFPSDLRGFTQCHFFAGIGVWSYALRAAGWPDDRPVWTGSCPCQPFSGAGPRTGFDDKRHLWPAFHHLIKECEPATVFGEQVASKDADPWIDLVQDDLEALGYALGAVPFPSAGVGAPHIRDRLYWVADAKRHHRGREAQAADHRQPQADRPSDRLGGRSRAPGGLDHTERHGRGARRRERHHAGHVGQQLDAAGADVAVGHSERDGLRGGGWPAADIPDESGDGPLRGFWRGAEWLPCRDGRLRPVEPGTSPLAHGAPARVVRLRAYGNAINAEAARVFIECVKEML